MASFGNVVAPIPVNPLMTYAQIQGQANAAQAGQLQNQGLQQTLTDQATLRSLAPQLASGDPNALSQAATLGANGVNAVTAVDAANTSRRTNLGAYAGMVGNFAGAVAALPSDQQAQAYAVGRQNLAAAGVPDTMLPAQHPGTPALLALRNSMIPAASQVELNANYPRFDGGASGGPMGAPIGGGNYLPGQGGAAGGGAAPGGQFNDDPVINALGGGESGNAPGKVNSQGYSGQFQFGAARLNDLGLYQPAQGENLKANTFQGQFNIPGFPGVQTYGDFLANGPAQRAAMHVQAADIENTIANTPGASQFNTNGLIAVAHLGGVGGMQKFVQTGGAYNPADSNGTHLSDYYSRYSQLGRVQLAADHGHPDGPLPGYTPPNAGGGVQVASTSGTAGMPATATDAGGAPSPTDIMNASLDRLRQQQGAGQPPPGASPSGPGAVDPGAGSPAPAPMSGPAPSPTLAAGPQPAQPNQLYASAGPVPGAPQRNQLMPPMPPNVPPPSPNQPGTFHIDEAAQPGTISVQPGGLVKSSVTNGLPPTPAGMVMGTKAGLPIPVQGQPGMVMGYNPATHQMGVMAAPGAVNTGRLTSVPNAQGGRDLISPSGQTVATSGPDLAARQSSAYQADLPVQKQMTESLQGAQAQMLRQNELADIAQQLQTTGPAGPGMAKAAVYLQSLGVSPERIQSLTGMSSGAAAQEFIKLGITSAGAATKNDLGSNAGVQALGLYQQANPNLTLLPDANKRVTNMARVGLQSVIDYNQGGLNHFAQNEQAHLTNPGAVYQPLTQYNSRWAQQANPLVYAGAMGVLNGDPVTQWGARLNSVQQQQAREIAARVDPNAGQPALADASATCAGRARWCCAAAGCRRVSPGKSRDGDSLRPEIRRRVRIPGDGAMSNPFDQFDQPAPASAGAGGPPPAAPSAAPAAAQAANPFDQFDAPQPVTGLGANVGAGLQTAGAGTINAASDPFGYLIGKPLLTAGMGAYNLGSRVFGYQPISQGAMNAALDDGPGIGDRAVAAVDRAGGVATPDQVVPANNLEKYARAGIQGATGLAVLGPAGLDTSLPRAVASVAKQGALGVVSGVGAQAASDAAPDDLKPAAGLVGGIVAPGLASMSAAIGQGAARPIVNGLMDYAAPAVGKPNALLDVAGAPVLDAQSQPVIATPSQARIAGQRIQSAATDPAAVRQTLDNSPPAPVPGAQPTTFQVTRDPGLGNLELGRVARGWRSCVSGTG